MPDAMHAVLIRPLYDRDNRMRFMGYELRCRFCHLTWMATPGRDGEFTDASLDRQAATHLKEHDA